VLREVQHDLDVQLLIARFVTADLRPDDLSVQRTRSALSVSSSRTPRVRKSTNLLFFAAADLAQFREYVFNLCERAL